MPPPPLFSPGAQSTAEHLCMSATTKTRLLAHDQEEADGAAHGHEKVDGELELRVVDGRVLCMYVCIYFILVLGLER